MNAFMDVIMIVGVFVLSSSFGVEVTVDVQPVNATEYQRTYLIYNYTRSLPTSVKSAHCRWYKVMSYEAMLIGSINSEGNNVVEKFTKKIYFDEDGNLVFTNITRKDTGTYECDVEIIDDKPYVNSDEVNVSVLYLDAPIIVIPKFVREGDDLDIFCQSGDAYPDPILKMHKDDQLISSTNGTTLKYTIINATIHDHGFYYCEAHNEAGSKTSNGDTLSVHYIRCQQKSDVNSIVAEGNSVSIPCQVNARPNPNYTFFKNNKVVKSGYVKDYMIEKATEEDTGKYHCMAVNNAGNVTCGQKNLLVPYCLISTFTLKKGHLTCVAEGQPEPNTTITVNGDVVANGKMTSTYGVVSCNVVTKCVAENGYIKTTKILKSCNTSGVSGNADMTTDVPLVGIMLGILGCILLTIIVFIKHRRLVTRLKCKEISMENENRTEYNLKNKANDKPTREPLM